MTRRLLMIGVLVGLVCLSTVNFAQAASAWYTCGITSVGVEPNVDPLLPPNYVFGLTDTGAAFTNQQFAIPQDADNNPKLSVFLTAVSAGLPVRVYLDPLVPTSLEAVHIWLVQ